MNRARSLRILQASNRVEALPPAQRRTWEASLTTYREQRAELAKQAANDWRLPKDELERIVAKRKDAHRALRETLDTTLARLAPALTHPASLPAPAPDELLVAYFPSDAGWLSFALLGGSVHVQPIASPNRGTQSRTLGSDLLAPLAPLLAKAKRVRFAPYGPLRMVDFHALPLDGVPLLERLPVVYGVDVEAKSRSRGASPFALVVGDPRGDLAAARKEARAVAHALRASKWEVRSLTGDAATHGAVRDALASEGLSFFHYAGHGVYEGRDGWESGLPLAGDAWLTVGDVLALPRVPRGVVLSGCETARSSKTARAAGLGLAQAFVVAGSNEVVAAVRPVNDALAAALMARLTQDPKTLEDLATGLAKAQAQLRKEHPAWDWAAFRVLVP